MDDHKTLLLADDNAKDIELTLAAFEEMNLANRVIIVKDGGQVLDFLYRRGEYVGRTEPDPDVILLDIKMPKVSGIEILKQIKSDEHLKYIPVVMLTSSREENDLVESYKYSANSYIVKPIDYKDFINTIKNLGFYWAFLNVTPKEEKKD